MAGRESAGYQVAVVTGARAHDGDRGRHGRHATRDRGTGNQDDLRLEAYQLGRWIRDPIDAAVVALFNEEVGALGIAQVAHPLLEGSDPGIVRGTGRVGR